MSDKLKDLHPIWSELTAGEPVPFEELNARIGELLETKPELARNPNATTSLAYSGYTAGSPGAVQARDLVDRSAGRIGSLDSTEIGKALGEYGSAWDAENTRAIVEKFDGVIDFGNALQNPRFNESEIFDNFKSASSSYASQVEGPVVTLTPDADNRRIFAKDEVPEILKGLENGRITSVNGESAADILKALENIPNGEFGKVSTDHFRASSDAALARAGYAFEVEPDGRLVSNVDAERAPRLGADLAGEKMMAGASITVEAAREMVSGEDVRGFAGDVEGNRFTFVDAEPETGRPRVITLHGGAAGVQYFDTPDEAMRAYGGQYAHAHKTFTSAGLELPEVKSGGLADLAAHAEDLRVTTGWEKVGRGLGAVGGFLGKASKVLGPVGVAATTAEASGLRDRAADLADMGVIDEDALLAYDALMAGHIAQGTADPTLVGGEGATQLAYSKWVDNYGIPDQFQEELRPGSLVRDVGAGAGWVAEKVGGLFDRDAADAGETQVHSPTVAPIDGIPLSAPGLMAITGPSSAPSAGRVQLSWEDVYAQMKADMPAVQAKLHAVAAASPEAAQRISGVRASLTEGLQTLDELRQSGAPSLEIPVADLAEARVGSPLVRLGRLLDAGQDQMQRSVPPERSQILEPTPQLEPEYDYGLDGP